MKVLIPKNLGKLPPPSKDYVIAKAKRAYILEHDVMTKARLERLDLSAAVLKVITAHSPYGIGVGALGHSISLTNGKAKRHAFPQAFAAYGYRLAQPLVDAGLVERFCENGSTRFRLAGKV